MKGNAKRKGDSDFMGAAVSQSRLLCSVVTAIAKLATCHRELSPRARVCLSKVRCRSMCLATPSHSETHFHGL
jgi:AP-5 complex subunit zeta-1